MLVSELTCIVVLLLIVNVSWFVVDLQVCNKSHTISIGSQHIRVRFGNNCTKQ